MQINQFSVQEVSSRIYNIRGQRVMLDRHPADFMFQLTEEEHQSLKSQNVILSTGDQSSHARYMPYVFTEQGVSMLSSVIKSKTAVQVNIAIMRTFVKLRGFLESNQDLAQKLNQLEQKFSTHDHQLKTVFDAIRQLMSTGSPVTQKKIKGLNHE